MDSLKLIFERHYFSNQGLESDKLENMLALNFGCKNAVVFNSFYSLLYSLLTENPYLNSEKLVIRDPLFFKFNSLWSL